MNSTATVVLLAAAVALASGAGCISIGDRAQLTDLQTVEQTVELDGAERVVAYLDMGVGELTITSGTDALLDAEFSYNVAGWDPVVDYTVKDGTGELRVRQLDTGGKSVPNGVKNTWKLLLNESVPLELNIDMGVGKASLDLGDLTLTDLTIDHGVGDLTLNLAGEHRGDMTASIEGGVGKITLTVPSSVGVRVESDTGIGVFRTHGLTEYEGSLVNDVYGEAEATIEVNIDTGIGSVTVQTSDTTSTNI